MGVNAPARTVVFDSLRKFDGKEFRQLLPGEYTQMAGRAGRRGLDKTGTVVVMCRDEIPYENDLKNVIIGTATRLESQFRLTYIMILHLLRVEELKVEDMLKRSFAEFHAQKKLPEQQQLLMLKLAQPTKSVECIKGEPAIEDYFDMYSEAEKYSHQIAEAVMQSPVPQQYLTTGRAVVVKSQSGQDHLLGVVVKTPSSNNKQYIVLVLTPELPSTLETSSDASNRKDQKTAEFQILMPKSRRGYEDEYCSSVTSRKGSGVVNIKLPHRGNAAGMNYEVRGVDNKDFLSICVKKIKIDQVRLLEDVSSGAYSNAIQQLLGLKSEGNKYPPALDPVKVSSARILIFMVQKPSHAWDYTGYVVGAKAGPVASYCIDFKESTLAEVENYRPISIVAVFTKSKLNYTRVNTFEFLAIRILSSREDK
ncbi:hypothetical protein FXO37_31276 [Capsicum annuum]|nr:hypothetical protein FXO37_31276 [Capsicum annuum]